MKITLSKYDIRRIQLTPEEDLVNEVIKIIHKHKQPLQTKIDELNNIVSTFHFRIKAQNRLLDWVMYHKLGLHYDAKKLMNDPERYLEYVEEQLKNTQKPTIV